MWPNIANKRIIVIYTDMNRIRPLRVPIIKLITSGIRAFPIIIMRHTDMKIYDGRIFNLLMFNITC